MSGSIKEKRKNTVLRMMGYIKPYWYLILLSTVGGIVKLSLPLLLPQAVKYFTDYVLATDSVFTRKQQAAEIIRCSAVLLALYFFVYIPAAYIRQIGATEVSNRVMNTMRCQVYEHLQKMSARFHREYQSGNLVTRINSDVEGVHDFIWNVATNIWIDAIMVVIYVSIMCSMNVILTVIAAIALPASVIITKHIRRQINSSAKKVQAGISDISGYMQERMAGYATVKLFNMEEYEKEKFNRYSNLIYHHGRRTNRFFSIGEAVTASLSESVSTIIVGLAALFITNGKMTIGDMIVFYSYLNYFMTPLRRFAELNVNYARSVAKIDRVFEIIDMPAEIQDRADALCYDAGQAMDIQFKRVFFKYRENQENWNLSDISFAIRDGERVAIVGSSGCGKTTLINLLARFYDVGTGSIEIAGVDIRDYKMQSLYQNMGMVFQDTVIFSGTIEDNVRYGKVDADREELEMAARKANAYDFIMDSPDGWQSVLGERGIGLSGGQKQRIAIARIFLRNPKLLILDEATSALDSESEQAVSEALNQLMEGRTSIVIAHRLSTVVNADNIIVMDEGRIVESGTHSELLKKGGRYAELYKMQFKDVLNREGI